MDSNDANKMTAAIESVNKTLQAIERQLAAINGRLGQPGNRD